MNIDEDYIDQRSTSAEIVWLIFAIAATVLVCFCIWIVKFGMPMAVLVLWIPMLFCLGMWFFSVLETTRSYVKRGKKYNLPKAIILAVPIMLAVGLFFYNAETFRAPAVLKAYYKDDLFNYYLTFREDGTCDNYIIGFMGYEETLEGTYEMKGDTILFGKKPYMNNFIADTMLVSHPDAMIYNYADSLAEGERYKKKSDRFKIIDLKE